MGCDYYPCNTTFDNGLIVLEVICFLFMLIIFLRNVSGTPLSPMESQISTNGLFSVDQQLIPDSEFHEVYPILDENGANQPKYKRFNHLF
jgi:hypothetical protein